MIRDPRVAVRETTAREPAVFVSVTATAGSTPREVGAWMIVTATTTDGSIGGGALEFAEIAHARALIAALGSGGLADGHRDQREIMLGVDAEQCCGGVVKLQHVVLARAGVDAPGDASRVVADAIDTALRDCPRLTLYGAGHVGRALVRVLRDVPIALDWVDIDRERFPTDLPDHVTIAIAADPAAHARSLAGGRLHLVMTHAHAIDEAICAALLARGDFDWLGLIGSKTKRARFLQRFRRAGMPEAAIARLVSPVGLAGIDGKEPAVIAVAVAAQLLTLEPVRKRLASVHVNAPQSAPADRSRHTTGRSRG